jgi:hypothetical protein
MHDPQGENDELRGGKNTGTGEGTIGFAALSRLAFHPARLFVTSGVGFSTARAFLRVMTPVAAMNDRRKI